MQGRGDRFQSEWQSLAYHLHKTVVLVGMMGCGKTAIGTELSRQLNVPFLDSDAEIEAAANATIAEIFARDGEEFFRQKESQILARLLLGAPCVLSTGGGAFLREDNRASIRRDGVSVWLDAPLDLLWQRVRHKTTRPLLMTGSPRQTLGEIFAARTPLYAQAELRVPTRPDYSISDMTEAVLDALLARPDVLTGLETNA
jgi:shikimate kinase